MECIPSCHWIFRIRFTAEEKGPQGLSKLPQIPQCRFSPTAARRQDRFAIR